MALLEGKNLSIGYDGKIIQNNLNFAIETGDYYFIIGENGTGKSTLMKTLLGFIKPVSGEILISKELSKNAIGYLPQQNSIQKEFPATVEEIVFSGFQNKLGFFPFYKKEYKLQAYKNMEQLGIETLAKKSFSMLSGGQQQRVLLTRALCAAEKILLLDEPVKGFDPKITQSMYEQIQELNKDGMTVIMISHDIKASEKYATKILELKRDRSLEK